MDNAMTGLKIAAAVLFAAVVITLAMTVSDKGTEVFKKSTEDVANSAQTIAGYYMTMYDEKIVSYDDFIEATQEFCTDFEIRYQTLQHQRDGIEYKIYPGTEKDGHVAVSTTSLDDLSSIDCINREAKWFATINENDQYILFKQEKD